MKKLVSLVVLAALLLAAINAAPAAAAESPSLASIIPADAAIFVEMDTSDVSGTLESITDWLSKAGVPVTSSMLFASIERDFTRLLGRSFTVEKDLLSWLGSNVAVAATFQERSFLRFGSPQPEHIVLAAAVKDDAAAQALLDELMALPQSADATRLETTAGGETVVTYQWPRNGENVTLWKGYAVITSSAGSLAWLLDNLKADGPTLAADPDYARVVSALKPGTLAKFYVGPGLIEAIFDQTLSAMRGFERLQDLVKMAQGAFRGQAVAVRGSGKELAIDIVQSVDPAARKQVLDLLGLPEFTYAPLAARLAERIPGDALAVIIWSDLSGLYTMLREGLPKMMLMIGSGQPDRRFGPSGLELALQVNTAFGAFEGALKTFFDLDMRDDVLSWTNGEFALYMVANLQSDLAAVRRLNWPFDLALLLEATDTARATEFVEKITSGIEKSLPVKPEMVSANLYKLTIEPPVSIGYGLVNDTVIFSTGSGLAAAASAARGDGVLSANPIWQRAMTIIGPTNQPILFLNLEEASAVLKTFMPASARNSQAGAVLNALELFESALIYGNDDNQGLTISTLALVLK